VGECRVVRVVLGDFVSPVFDGLCDGVCARAGGKILAQRPEGSARVLVRALVGPLLGFGSSGTAPGDGDGAVLGADRVVCGQVGLNVGIRSSAAVPGAAAAAGAAAAPGVAAAAPGVGAAASGVGAAASGVATAASGVTATPSLAVAAPDIAVTVAVARWLGVNSGGSGDDVRRLGLFGGGGKGGGRRAGLAAFGVGGAPGWDVALVVGNREALPDYMTSVQGRSIRWGSGGDGQESEQSERGAPRAEGWSQYGDVSVVLWCGVCDGCGIAVG